MLSRRRSSEISPTASLAVDQRVAERLLGGVDHALVGRDLGDVELPAIYRSIVPSRRIFRCSCMMP